MNAGVNKYKMIERNVRDGSKDNVLIIYNSALYELEDSIKFKCVKFILISI